MASFIWTPPGGSTELTLTLPRPLKFRSGSLGRLRSRFRSIGLDQRTSVTELLTSSRADVVEGVLRFIEEPALLSQMLEDGASGSLLTYVDDAGASYPSLLLESTGPVTEVQPDADRWGFGEWQRTLRLRATTGERLTRLFPNFVPTALVIPSGATDYASVPDSAALDIGSDIDLRLAFRADSYFNSQRFMTKWGSGLSWILAQNATGPQLTWRDSTNTQRTAVSTAAFPGIAGDLVLMRATLDADNGTGGSAVTFYTKAGLTAAGTHAALVSNTGWTQLGSVVTVATTNGDLQQGDDDVHIGHLVGGGGGFAGKVYAAAVLDGIAGDVVLDIPFSDAIPGLRSFEERADAATVTVEAAARLELDF